MYSEIKCCRICGNKNLVSLLNLGDQTLTGVFPKSRHENITSGPLELVKCHPKDKGGKVCHLVQLRHSYSNDEMYNMNYGYRSGLNASMVGHLKDIVDEARSLVDLHENDLIVDIGSNDSTLLQQYPIDKNLTLIGIDPTGKKYAPHYPERIQLIPDFFSSDTLQKKVQGTKAKIITSIAMFYDLEEPLQFVQEVYDSLADNGIWILEQSYLPTMLSTTAYDTICHEHLEYYALSQLEWLFNTVGFKVIDAIENDINGGSFKLVVAKKDSSFKIRDSVNLMREKEKSLKLDELSSYEPFKKNIIKHKEDIRQLLQEFKKHRKKVLGYGASTKGNVILQYCGISAEEIPYIAEVNEDKFGAFTPFTNIPIIPEQEAREMKPDYFLVMPWHFKKGILEKENDFMARGGKFIFPLPTIEIIGS